MRKTLLASVGAVAAAALLVPLATADHKPNHPGKDDPPNPDLTISADPTTVRWHRAVTISGRLRGPDNSGKTIELQENPHPFSGAFKPAGTTTTDANGDYSFQPRPDEHTLYRVEADVDPREVSETVGVRVRMRVTRRVSDRTPADGDEITFSGRVGPAHPGMHVLLQRRKRDGTWKTMTSTPLTAAGANSQSTYSTEVTMNRDGVWRARVRKDENHLGNKSRRVRIDVQ